MDDATPTGYVKSILPCTPLAIVKCLEHIGVYNRILPYGDRAYGKTVTVINRCVVPSSEIATGVGLRRAHAAITAIEFAGLRSSVDRSPRSSRTTARGCSPSTLTQSRYVL